VAWTVTSGSLPTGLSLNASTGIISGTPTVAGTSNFTVEVSDDLSNVQTFTDSGALSIKIAQGTSPAPSTPTSAPSNGPIFTGSTSALPGFIKPRAEIVYPDGHVVFLDQPAFTRSITYPHHPRHHHQRSRDQVVSRSLPTIALEIAAVMFLALQQFLNTHGFTVATTGPGSPGNENFFGAKTFQALKKFQQAHNLPATGYLGPLTRTLISHLP
jgi:Putative Ig domain/Putative peptidoglycan binding domain